LHSFDGVDPLALGQRIRHFRRRAGLTLAQLGERIGRSVPYLSQLENGKVEARIGTVNDLAGALGCSAAELLDPTPPSRRAELEIELLRAQRSEHFARLGLAPLRIAATIPDDVLEHLVELHRATHTQGRMQGGVTPEPAGAAARRVSAGLRREMRARGNYLPDLERAARKLLRAADYLGHGPVSERAITGLAGYLGLRIERVAGIPSSTRSVTDHEARVIYIGQRDEVSIRSARSAIVQALSHFALRHTEPADVEAYLRQRVEANYLAAAILCPETPAVRLLKQLEASHDLSVEDVKEAFYLSYEMASHRFTNLATRHLDMPVHFLRTSREGVIGKAYENDGLPLPVDDDGGIEGQRIPAHWSARRAWQSPDSLHQQHTRLPVGEFFCISYIETEGERTPHAITVGTTAAHARRFRGFEQAVHEDGRKPSLRARTVPPGAYTAVAAQHSHALSAPTAASRPYVPFAEIDSDAVADFIRDMRRRGPPARVGKQEQGGRSGSP
jgi:transcriptional regulator with XRE-family HTH domain/predicted transcriptional regulator